ncbi:hypothetical protein [Aphanothece sacrum]|uniref:Uncharacterized protein n=1 Tax=Aphanothece sacrum FPU1 TaxID=1920663 RepID=A0A401IH50_APHSA|nr:hypothetical protein [Aphanothece sacrum]GBF80625.1 hypothetical protein AsFPU1_2029 [Aphanothece sacrum FPU1]GBF83985.1 hypothetical protein AsFPU3_1029 [Aphanothece sacrum FPU3]
MIADYWDKIGDGNPQLLREIKGRLNPRNTAIAVVISVIGQLFLLLIFNSNLPSEVQNYDLYHGQFNRYCTATPPPEIYQNSYYGVPFCIQDLLGNWVINWQLWWFDVFRTLSIVGIFVLLVAGIYLLIADLSREENRGTLNFIRLSPRTPKNLLLGKMLGVPCLVYLMGLIAFPLHLIAAFNAHIPISLILGFYGVILSSCAFFYSGALLYGLVSSSLGGFQAFLGSGGVLFGLFILTSISFASGDSVSQTPFDWVMLFYPGTILSYLAKSTFLPTNTLDFNYENLNNLRWYGQTIWQNTWLGIGFIVFNYGLWTYWIGQALKRRFHNPTATWLSKYHSYYLSASFIIMVLGFVFQPSRYGSLSQHLRENFLILQTFIVAFSCLLMVALSPHRQTLQDWARYRHYNKQHHRSIMEDLILGEKSPSIIAIAVNLGIIFVALVPGILLAPVENKFFLLLGLLLGMNMILIYSIIGQRILMLKTPKSTLIATLAIGSLITLPPMGLGMLGLFPDKVMTPWLFTFLPLVVLENMAKCPSIIMFMFSILGQSLLITLGGFEMKKQLQKVGESQTKLQETSI